MPKQKNQTLRQSVNVSARNNKKFQHKVTSPVSQSVNLTRNIKEASFSGIRMSERANQEEDSEIVNIMRGGNDSPDRK